MNAAHPLTVAAAVRDRPDPRNTWVVVYVGDLALTAECTVSGKHRPAVTQADPLECYPEEWPEVEIARLWLSGPWRDLSDLLADERIKADVQKQCDDYVSDHDDDGPDPDDAYDRWRDRQTEDR